jgi:hypothetical protein
VVNFLTHIDISENRYTFFSSSRVLSESWWMDLCSKCESGQFANQHKYVIDSTRKLHFILRRLLSCPQRREVRIECEILYSHCLGRRPCIQGVSKISIQPLLLFVTNHILKKSSIFWDETPCSPLKVNRRFREHVASIFRVEEQSKQER